MAGPADTLKVFPAVWVTGIQSSDDPRRHDMVHMAGHIFQLENSRRTVPLPNSRERKDSIVFPTSPHGHLLGHFRCTRSQGISLSRVLNRAKASAVTTIRAVPEVELLNGDISVWCCKYLIGSHGPPLV
jgi:hypothetical protein